MAKVYRLHNEGQDGTGWFISKPISTKQLETIKTEGKDVATSIPSPFARIDLVKSAFAWVADNGINGTSAQHKLVSDSLDVAQLFFLYPKYKDKIKIISWSPNDRFTDLMQDTNSKHSTFAKTLKVFWDQDSSIYNFNKVNRLYFLLNNANQLIGGTSPATLFFASPDVKTATRDLVFTCASDVLFDDKYFSLDKRETSFIEYIFTLSKQPNFADLFPEIYSYLNEVKKLLNDGLKTIIANISITNINNYQPCPVSDNAMNPCEILNIQLGIQNSNPSDVQKDSDFVIESELPINGFKPLVLPDNRFSNQWTYTIKGVIWDPNNNIPYRNTNLLDQSVIPVQGDTYPWLTIGNFLEDKIIELPYTIDSTKFKTCGAKKRLLPLTPTFFKYFKAENVSNYLTLAELSGGGVEATLHIPTKRGNITFKKTYHKTDIVKLEIHLAILPFLRTSTYDLDYTLGLQDKRFDRSQELFIECFGMNKRIDISAPVVRKQGEGNTIKSSYYKTKSFDAIRVGNSLLSGFIIPSMTVCGTNQQVSFAIDFGTTNTHMEYKYGVNAEKAIDISTDLPMWQSLIDRKEGETLEIADDNNYEREIFPYQFNNSTNYKFPFRTALTYNKDIDFNQPIDIFAHTNNFFLFEKTFYPNYFQLHTKLKWSNYSKKEDRILVESYIECLLYIALYKTILLNGNPQATEITWFYPVSMDSFEQGIFFELWQKAYQKIFNSNNTINIHAIPESIAPYLYYRNSYPGLSLSIDVGGGSSDIAIFKNANNMPEFISSFRFAGNAIFGDGFPNGAFSNSSDNNGFVKNYKDAVENAIGSNLNKKEILSDIIENRKDSADFSSFLFSLEKENGIKFSYTDLLRQDRKLKLPILLFYGAIIYYSANLIKKYGINEIPKNILFSGTASKTIKILDSHNDFKNISNLFRYIFNQEMDNTVENLIIALSENPKEITCKGVLRANINEDITNCPMVFWLGGNNSSVWSKVLNKKTDIQNTPYYKELDIKTNKDTIENSINQYFLLLDEYFKKTNLEGNFGIDNSAYLIFKKMRSLNIQDYLEQGEKAFFNHPEKHIEETLFFYPLIGILNKLALELSNTDNQ